MKASLLLVAALLVLCGMSFLRRSRLPGSDGSQLVLGLLCWFLAVVFGVIACMAIAKAQDAIPVNPDVTTETIKATICVHNWTAKVRPPVSVTNRIKREQMEAAGIPWERAHEIELDHRVPLALGGAPHDPANLWLQTWAPLAPEGWKVESDAHLKDHLEVRLRDLVCAGRLELGEAQRCIFEDWRACAAKYPAH